MVGYGGDVPLWWAEVAPMAGNETSPMVGVCMDVSST